MSNSQRRVLNYEGLQYFYDGLAEQFANIETEDKVDSALTLISDKVDKVDGKGLSTNDYTTAEKNKLEGIATGAEVNQNAFSNIKIGTSTIGADSKTDTLTLAAGSNITLTPDTTNDKVTIAVSDLDTTLTTSGKIADAKTIGDRFSSVETSLAGKASTAVATSTTNGLMSKEDKKHLDYLKPTQISASGKTIPELKTAIEGWLGTTAAINYPHAVLKFNAGSWIDLWNSDNTTSTISGGSWWVLTVKSWYSGAKYSLLEINSYSAKGAWYVAIVNGVWSKISKVRFADEYISPSYIGTSDANLTATVAELNKLDGATISTSELNQLKGTTSPIQTQLNSLNTKFSDYTTTSDLNTQLNNYVTNTSLNTTLGSYATTTALSNLDSKVTNIIGGVTEAELNTLKELSDALNDDADFGTTVTNSLASLQTGFSTLESEVNGKAPISHNAATNIYGASSSTLYGHAMASSTTPKANGTAAVGTETAKFARGDHVHPAQTAVSGNAGTATKLATARTIALKEGAVGTATAFDGSKDISIPVTSIKEAYLTWGGRNFNYGFGPLDAAMTPVLGANRLAFANKNGIILEYSTNGGSSWTTLANEVLAQKLFADTSADYATLYIGNSSATYIDKTQYLVRVTLNTSAAQVYTSLNKFAINVSTNGSDGCYCTIEGRLESNRVSDTNTWVTFADRIGISGWSGWNIINTSSITTYGNSPTIHYGQVRFTFGVASHPNTSQHPGLQIRRILGFGGVGWTTPSNAASTGAVYKTDYLQNATFPAKISSQSLEASSLQIKTLYAPTTSGGSSYGVGSANQVLSSNGSSTYWKTLSYLPLNGGTLTGNLSLSSAAKLTLNTTIKDHANPTYQALVINCEAVPSETTQTDKNSPGIGFHITSRGWGSLVFNGSDFRFINNDATGYMPVYSSKFYGDLEGNAKTASNVAWSGITSKPSYYDAKAIKSITRSGTTFTYTCLDNTTGTFTQQDNNTTYSAGSGLTLSNTTFNVGAGTGIAVADDTVSAKLRSTTALTVDSAVATTTSGRVYPVAVDKTGYLAVNVPWTDTKNTAGSTNTSDKIYLIGATSQAANPQTYSHDTVYVDANGDLNTSKLIINTTNTPGIKMNRGSYNYIQGSSNGPICFVANDTVGLANASLVANTGGVHPGATDTYDLGNSTYRWRNITVKAIATTTINATTYTGGAATTSAAGLMSATDKTKLDNIANNANNYSLPAATTSALGGVIIGNNISLSSGKISLTKNNVTTALGATGSPLCVKLGYNQLVDLGIVSASCTTENLVTAMANNTEVSFVHNKDVAVILTDAPATYGYVTLNKGYNSNYVNGWFHDISGNVFAYKYHTGNTASNGWKQVYHAGNKAELMTLVNNSFNVNSIANTVDIFTLAPGVYHCENTTSTTYNFPIEDTRATIEIFGQYRSNTPAADGYNNGYWTIRVTYKDGKQFTNHRSWSNWSGWKTTYNDKSLVYSADEPTNKIAGMIWLKPI